MRRFCLQNVESILEYNRVGQKTFVSRPTRFSKNAFDVLETKTSHNMRLFAGLFGYSALI